MHKRIPRTHRTTHYLATIALISALSALLSFVEFPLFLPAPFLKYDASFVPAALAALSLGPQAGISVGIIAACAHGLLSGNIVGAIMNIIAVIAFVLPAGLLYKTNPKFVIAVLGLVVGIACATVCAILANLTVGVAFWYGNADVLYPLIVPILLPFNLLKGILNTILCLALFPSTKKLLDQKAKALS